MAQDITINGATYEDVPGLSVPKSGGGTAYFMDPTELFYANAGAHNSIYRGKPLGSAVTDEQYRAIRDGDFKDLYIGDYWTINGIDWVICDFDTICAVIAAPTVLLSTTLL